MTAGAADPAPSHDGLTPALLFCGQGGRGLRRRMGIMGEATRTRPTLAVDDSRRFQRVKVNLLGRFMLPSRREYPCQVTDMSPGGAALRARVVRHVEGGIAVEFAAVQSAESIESNMHATGS